MIKCKKNKGIGSVVALLLILLGCVDKEMEVIYSFIDDTKNISSLKEWESYAGKSVYLNFKTDSILELSYAFMEDIKKICENNSFNVEPYDEQRSCKYKIDSSLNKEFVYIIFNSMDCACITIKGSRIVSITPLIKDKIVFEWL